MKALPEERAIALIDGNNFYVSCERVFNPKLRNKPLVILSNNDGCIVSRSQEARDLGIPMGMPFFKAKHLVDEQGLLWLSSNYTLYGDMSARMMAILSEFSPNQEIYSIDECFLDLSKMMPSTELIPYGKEIRSRVDRYLGLPTCVGIGPSKTLAKLANHIAKKNQQFGGVFAWAALSGNEQSTWMKKIAVGEVWGVGRRLNDHLKSMGIETVYDLAISNPEVMRKHFSVVMARTVAELQGVSCLDLEEVEEVSRKQQIISSKSFGQPMTDLAPLQEAVASYVCRAAEKLRAQKSVCHFVTVFVRTNPFAKHQTQYRNQLTVPLSIATADSRRLVRAALFGLDQIYKQGLIYKKAGIILSDIRQAENHQGDLFTKIDEEKSKQVMHAMDALNHLYGANTVVLASTGATVGNPRFWRMRANHKSPRFTTRWNEIPAVKTEEDPPPQTMGKK
jgi:DNA polymerase V